MWVYAAILPASVACNRMSDAGTGSSEPMAPTGVPTAVTPPLTALSGGAMPSDKVSVAAEIGAALGISPGDLNVVSIERETWPDGCLGLAAPGQVCSQALVDGWLAVVRLPDGTEQRFRGGGGRVVAEPR